MKLFAVFTAVAAQLLTAEAVQNTIGPQSQYNYEATAPLAGKFDWDINITSFLSIDKPTTMQGIYNLRSTYTLDHKSFDVELFKDDCLTAPSGIGGDTFPLKWKDATESVTGPPYVNVVEMEWTYNQTEIEESDLWTANKTGGNAYFCIRVNNYLPDGADAFYAEMNFLEIKYQIAVDSLTDFNTTIEVIRTEALEGEDFINYEEEIDVFHCNETFMEVPAPTITQGDFIRLCVKTVDDSKFGVHSIKELDLSQLDSTPTLYPYIDDFTVSPLAETDCTLSNTTDAVCMAKMQLLSAYFDEFNPAHLFANGTVKLDYVGRRRLSVDVPMNFGANDESVMKNRMLAAKEGDPSFGMEIEITGDEKESSSFVTSAGGVLSAGAAVLAAGLL